MNESAQEYRMQRIFRSRLLTMAIVATIIFFIFLIKLLWLQVSQGKENHILAKKFASLDEFIIAPRGLIYDRNYPDKNISLVQNIRYIDYVIYPNRFRNYQEFKIFLETFCTVMAEDCTQYFKIWKNKATYQSMIARNVVLTLMERISREEQERISTFRLTGTYGRYITRYMRHYTMGHGLAHVTGFLGYPTAKDLEKNTIRSYQTIGKAGIEKQYDRQLRGKDGLNIRYRSVNTQEEISETEPGSFLVLNIDRKIQATAYRSLVRLGNRGTVIVIKPDTGAILALAITPSYDPNIIAGGDSTQRAEHLKLIRSHQSFLNVATQAKYPPASTIKPLMLLAALEARNKKIDQQKNVFCPGHYFLKSTQLGVADAKYRCWEARGHGFMNMHQALTHSCDVYFYQLGYQMGPTTLIEYAKSFGLNRKTGIDLPGEINGVVPDQKWKRYHFSSRWYDGDTLNFVIGQGFLETTPMAIALLYSAIINRGKIYRPQLVREIRNTMTNQVEEVFKPELIREIPISVENDEILQRMMRDVVVQGTGIYIKKSPLAIAGKTGTAQSRSRGEGEDHAWFVGYAPYGSPLSEQVLVVVFIESGISGGSVASPIAREVLETSLLQ